MPLWSSISVVEEIEVKPPAVFIQGLPGLGLVGKLTVEYLIEELKPKRFAEVYSSYLAMPDGSIGVQITADGSFFLPRLDLYAHTASAPSLILMTGDSQPASVGQYEVANAVLEFVQRFGCKRVVALGGFHTTFDEEVGKVYGVFSPPSLFEQLAPMGVSVTQKGAITGACGVILGVGQQRKMECIGLLGATRGEYPDIQAAKGVLEVLSKLLGLNLNLKRLDVEIESMKVKLESLRRVQAEYQKRIKAEAEKSSFYV